jgi:hypothetical protein
VARVYDFLLGGSHNFEADWEMARRMIATAGDATKVARANRAFLRRAMGELGRRECGSTWTSGGHSDGGEHARSGGGRVESGVRGPRPGGGGGRHEHGGGGRDLREPDLLLRMAEATGCWISGNRWVLMLAVLPFVTDEERPGEAVARLRDAVAPGSYVVLSHGASDAMPPQGVQELYRNRATSTMTRRTKEQVEGFLDGWEVQRSGVVWLPAWRPDEDQADLTATMMYGAMGRKA